MVLPFFPSTWMTVWHLSVSLSMHLAHLASPVIVFSLGFSAAKVGVESANIRRPTTPTASNDTLFIRVLFCSIRLIPTKIRQLGPSAVQTGKAQKSRWTAAKVSQVAQLQEQHAG